MGFESVSALKLRAGVEVGILAEECWARMSWRRIRKGRVETRRKGVVISIDGEAVG